ncbi:MAG: 16S rRNA (uracil(1498)-N(3))-methyltransferase [Chloroflexi bacterium]|nr:16S rRNA (uracil(1498)-N(3))-methyltransferase [Chloroflexota bacterium]
MHRFFITEEIKDNIAVISDAAQFHHLKHVLRLRSGDEVIVCDRHGDEFVCGITDIQQGKAVLAVREKRAAQVRKVSITVACAVPGKGKFDEIVDNLTQLGVDAVIPMETERVVVKFDDVRGEARLKRWQKIAQSAARQSQRSTAPEVKGIVTLESVLSLAQQFDLKLLPTLYGERKHIKEVLAEAQAKKILVLIGPEGDFTTGEVERAKRAGFIPVSLGDSVLRVSTAATTIVSYIMISEGF